MGKTRAQPLIPWLSQETDAIVVCKQINTPIDPSIDPLKADVRYSLNSLLLPSAPLG